MSSTPPPLRSSTENTCIHLQALEAAQQKLLEKDRHVRRLGTELATAQTKVGKLSVDNMSLRHKNLILRMQANEAEKDLKDMKDELYRIIEELKSTQEGERQARKDTSIALGEVERLNGVTSGLMKELEEAQADTTGKEAEHSREESYGAGDEAECL